MLGKIQVAVDQVISGTVGKAIDNIGYVSIGTGVGLNVATPSVMYSVSWMPHTWPEWAAAFSILGAISLILKNIIETVINVRRRNSDG